MGEQTHGTQFGAIGSYLVYLLLQDLLGDLKVLQSAPQLLVLLLQTTPLLLHAVQLVVETDGHVLRHLEEGEERVRGKSLAQCISTF